MADATWNQGTRADEPRFFARTNFPLAPNQKPKWHRIARVRTEKTPGNSRLTGQRYTALCGYSYVFNIMREPALRQDVKTKALRCKDCDRKYEKEQNQ